MSGEARILFLNGRFVSTAAARVSALDRGLLFGDGLFETVRTYAGRPFALPEHLLRLRRAAERIRLPLPRGHSWWRAIIAGLLRRNGLDRSDAAVRLTITRGVGRDGLLLPRRPSPTVLVTARRLPASIERLQASGVEVTLLPFHPGLGGYLSSVKTTDYLTAALGKTRARERGAFEGLYVTDRGHILEGTTSNVFVVRGRTVETPPCGGDVLPGVTRDKVLRLARDSGFTVRERPLLRAALLSADEAFLTASTIEILPIRELDGRRIGRGAISRTRELQVLFREHREAVLKASAK